MRRPGLVDDPYPPPAGGRHDGAGERFHALDGMRGLAAAAVVLLHLFTTFGLPHPPHFAHLAVDFFFMLSGFVLARAYARPLAEGLGAASFLAARATRLYPMVLVGAAIGAAALAARVWLLHDGSVTSVAVSLVSGLLLLPCPSSISGRMQAFPVNSPFWSLSAEVVANVVFLFAARGAGRLQVAGLALLAGAVGVATAFAVGNLDAGFFWTQAWVGYARGFAGFFLGVLVAHVTWRWTRTARWAVWTPLGLFVALLLPLPKVAPLEAAFAYLLFPVLLGAASLAPKSRRIDGLWSLLGEASYPVYAINYPLFGLAANALKILHASTIVTYVVGVAVFLAMFPLAICMARLVETPMRRWLKVFFSSLVLTRQIQARSA